MCRKTLWPWDIEVAVSPEQMGLHLQTPLPLVPDLKNHCNRPDCSPYLKPKVFKLWAPQVGEMQGHWASEAKTLCWLKGTDAFRCWENNRKLVIFVIKRLTSFVLIKYSKMEYRPSYCVTGQTNTAHARLNLSLLLSLSDFVTHIDRHVRIPQTRK